MDKQFDKLRFMIIDDDPINNHICSKYINMVFSHVKIQTFTDPEKGLEYIETNYPIIDADKTILFLDINMPLLTGWEVMEKITQFPDALKDHYIIFVLSSSVAKEDQQKAEDSPYIFGFIEKPLTTAQLQAILHDI